MLKRLAAICGGAALALLAAPALSQPPTPPQPTPSAGDFTMKDFHFADGETLPQLRLHYTTFGAPHRGADGHVDNAVLIMHGTGGAGTSLIRPIFSGELFGPGQLLDARRYFIILPDDIGHGKSSKPSDGLRAHFPHYGYADMVEAEHRLVTEGLHVDHLRLVMGTSMGCMHTFMWGENWPRMMDALMPLACDTVQIAGRNRVWRDMILYAITSDPAWQGGDYKTEPREALLAAADIIVIAGSAPQQMHKALPTRDAADAWTKQVVEADIARTDANDELYQVASSGDYDPSAKLGDIVAPVMWVNSADDFINPPELGIAEQEVKQIKRGRFVLLPIGPNTHGHGTHTYAVAWKQYLAQLLAEFGEVRALAASAALFGIWMVSWLVAAVWSRRTQARSSFAGELLHRVPTVVGGLMVGVAVRQRVDGFALWGLPPAVDWTLTGLCAVGFAFTWWARLTLGDLWSGSITRKQGHRVVENGPYALARHPIYTGLILAFFAVGLQSGRPLGLVGAALVAFGFWLKGRIEERFLAAELGEAAYADYRRRVPMLVPFWPMGR